jgi:phenylacetic acid degradation operon negative regulatory protein
VRSVIAYPEIEAKSLHPQRSSTDLLSRAIVFDANLSVGDAPQRLVSLGWDLEDLAARYQRLARRFERVRIALTGAPSLDPQVCFIVRTLLIHKYRRLHLRDPLLPSRLLRTNWPGAQAAPLARDIYASIFAPSEIHLSHVASQLQGPLPEPDPSVMQRFGGIALKAQRSGR